jgi:hypothetical protein
MRAKFLVRNGGRWPAKLTIVVTAVPQDIGRPSTVLLLGSRVIEESSIKPPITSIINAFQGT